MFGNGWDLSIFLVFINILSHFWLTKLILEWHYFLGRNIYMCIWLGWSMPHHYSTLIYSSSYSPLLPKVFQLLLVLTLYTLHIGEINIDDLFIFETIDTFIIILILILIIVFLLGCLLVKFPCKIHALLTLLYIVKVTPILNLNLNLNLKPINNSVHVD
jgi:hypothetical protein